MCVQRKIESDSSPSEDSKKPRTAEAETGNDEAGAVMGECGESLIDNENGNGTTAGGSSQPATAEVEEENHMSVDEVVEDTTGAASLPSDNIVLAVDLPANGIQSTGRSSDSDVIDVDEIDTESGSTEAQKDKSADYGNPLELGLNEYYLQPASEDRPAENIIDVDAETVEAADTETVAVSTTSSVDTSLATDDKKDVGLKEVEEKSGVNEIPAVSTDRENIVSELNVNASDDGPATATSSADVEDQSKEPVARSPRSSAGGDATSPAGGDATSPAETSEDASKSAEDKSDGDVADISCVEVENAEPESASSTGHGDVQRLNAADIGEMVTEVVEQVVANQQRSTEKDAATVSADAGNDKEEDQAVEPGMEVLATPQTAPAEYMPPVCDTEEVSGKPVQAECVEEHHSVGEKMADSADTSQTETAEVMNDDNTSQEKIENSDSKDMTDTAQLTEMTDKPVSDSEPVNQSLESMDTVVPDGEDVKESAEVINGATADVENIEQSAEKVENVVAEVVLSDAEKMQPTAEDAEEPAEITEKVDVSACKDAEDMMAVDSAVEITRAETDEDISQSKDMTDMPVNDEAGTEKIVAEEDGVPQCKDVPDNSESSEQPAEMAAETGNGEDVGGTEETKDMVVSDDAEVTENVVAADENISRLSETKHTADREDKVEQLQSDVIDEVPTAAGSATEAGEVMDTDGRGKNSVPVTTVGGEVTQAVENSAMSASDGECNQQATDVTDKVETDELTHSTVTKAHIEPTTDQGCGKMSGVDTAEMELTEDKMSEAGEIVSEANAECHDGKAMQEEEVKITAESLMSTDEVTQ